MIHQIYKHKLIHYNYGKIITYQSIFQVYKHKLIHYNYGKQTTEILTPQVCNHKFQLYNLKLNIFQMILITYYCQEIFKHRFVVIPKTNQFGSDCQQCS